MTSIQFYQVQVLKGTKNSSVFIKRLNTVNQNTNCYFVRIVFEFVIWNKNWDGYKGGSNHYGSPGPHHNRDCRACHGMTCDESTHQESHLKYFKVHTVPSTYNHDSKYIHVSDSLSHVHECTLTWILLINLKSWVTLFLNEQWSDWILVYFRRG